MTDLARQTPRQRANFHYMAEAMRRFEWDLHNMIESTGHIPEEWHNIAQTKPRHKKRQVNLSLEEDVVKFFRALGPGYGARINAILSAYMHGRLAGVVRGADTLNHYKTRAEYHDCPKHPFGEFSRMLGEDWEDAPDEDTSAMRRTRAMEILRHHQAK